MDGVITGGWGYVAAAWGLSLSILAIYTGSVVLRLRRERSGK